MTLPDRTLPKDDRRIDPDRIHVLFEGLDRPTTLVEPRTVLPTLAAVVHAWPATFVADAPPADPFATLRPVSPASWELDAHLGGGAKVFDPVNAVCDFVAELSWERLRSRPDLLCLHAAAVTFGDALVLFPSGRRSGKSSLAAALARNGHRLFSDDFVPVEIDRFDGTIRGLANGIAPRLRQPLPEESSDAFRAWVAADAGPSNRQYKYLTSAPLAPANTALPLGAVVLLDRQDDASRPHLEEIAPEETLSRLILQNFARTAHAGSILKAIHALVAGLHCFRLRYSGFEAAAAFLAAHPGLADLAPARLGDGLPDGARAVLPGERPPVADRFDPAARYVQAPGITETGAGADSFLADGDGTAIHRLNPGSTVVWRLLAEPMDLDGIAEVMAEAFPGTDPARIRADTEPVLRAFLAARLIVPAPHQPTNP